MVVGTEQIRSKAKEERQPGSVSMKNAGNPRRATLESRQTLFCAVCADPESLKSAPRKAAFTLRHLELSCVAAVVIEFHGLEIRVYWRLENACLVYT